MSVTVPICPTSVVKSSRPLAIQGGVTLAGLSQGTNDTHTHLWKLIQLILHAPWQMNTQRLCHSCTMEYMERHELSHIDSLPLHSATHTRCRFALWPAGWCCTCWTSALPVRCGVRAQHGRVRHGGRAGILQPVGWGQGTWEHRAAGRWRWSLCLGSQIWIIQTGGRGGRTSSVWR